MMEEYKSDTETYHQVFFWFIVLYLGMKARDHFFPEEEEVILQEDLKEGKISIDQYDRKMEERKVVRRRKTPNTNPHESDNE